MTRPTGYDSLSDALDAIVEAEQNKLRDLDERGLVRWTEGGDEREIARQTV